MAANTLLADVICVYLIISFLFKINSALESSNKNDLKANKSSEMSESNRLSVRGSEVSEIFSNDSDGNHTYFRDEDPFWENENYSENISSSNSSYLNANTSDGYSISNLITSVTSILNRSYKIFGLQNNTNQTDTNVENKTISANTTKHLLPKNSSYDVINKESLSKMTLAIVENNLTQKSLIQRKDIVVTETQHKSENQNINSTRDYVTREKSTKWQNNSQIHENINDCITVANTSWSLNSTFSKKSDFNSSNNSLNYEKECNHTIDSLIKSMNNESSIHLDISLMTKFIEISNRFSFKLYKFMSSVYPNFIFSPLSISILLTLLLRASSGDSYNEIFNTLELNKSDLNSSSVQNCVENIVNYFELPFNSLTGLELELKNGICLKDGTKVITNFLQDSNKFFGAKVKAINLKLGNKRTVDVIEKWIRSYTKSRLLRNVIMLDSLNEDSNIMMFNNIYFTAQWIPDLQNNLLIKSDFYALGSRIIRTQFIQKAVTLKNINSRLFESSILEMPFHSNNNQKRFALIIILPQNNHSLESVEKKIFKDSNLFFNELSNMSSNLINIMIPHQFLQSECWRLDRILPHIGIKSVFQPETSLLTRISVTKNMHISRIYHESYFEFKRLNNHIFRGSQSSQLTANVKPVVIESDFIANKPFLYLIAEQNSTAVILMGRVTII